MDPRTLGYQHTWWHHGQSWWRDPWIHVCAASLSTRCISRSVKLNIVWWNELYMYILVLELSGPHGILCMICTYSGVRACFEQVWIWGLLQTIFAGGAFDVSRKVYNVSDVKWLVFQLVLPSLLYWSDLRHQLRVAVVDLWWILNKDDRIEHWTSLMYVCWFLNWIHIRSSCKHIICALLIVK